VGKAAKPAPAGTDGFVRYEVADKFWAVRADPRGFTVRFGKLGTAGQEQVKTFDDAATALKALAQLVASKTKKGYREV
jgi:predicted DNA-binding WGR domain protein